MKSAPKRKATERDAVAALYGVYQRHGHEGFVINRGPDRAALILAVERGWLFGYNDHVRITSSGLEQLAPYLERASA
jgi:hypothetical protein